MRRRRKRRGHRNGGRGGSGPVARGPGCTLTSHTLGALPIINRVLKRLRLEEFFEAYLPREDGRTKVATSRGLLVVVRNLLTSREPLYGVGEWAARYAPDVLGLLPEQVACLNDDRVGRCLDRLLASDYRSLALAVATHMVGEFGVALDELHNDSTTITFYGAYAEASEEKQRHGRKSLAITWGYNKDHRPDLKQLLYLLTVAEDGGVPVHFEAASGNVTDDTTHRKTWDLLVQLAGRRDFLYVADCKLATRENMAYLHQRQGRFISVLPRTRAEDAAFRRLLAAGQITWKELHEKKDEKGQVIDRFSVSSQPALSAEGYRVVWYHSTRKAELDALDRSHRIERASKQLAQLREKLRSARSRYRQKAKVEDAVAEILQSCGARRWIVPQIDERLLEGYRQVRRGRPGPDTRYRKKVTTRFDLGYAIDHAQVAADSLRDGIFPLVTNVLEMSESEVLLAYKRQPVIEKRFSQLKTDFGVAPVYLKQAGRIEALLCLYFFALMVQALLERELRQAIQREAIDALPMYPEGRPCRRPTTRRLVDLFDNVQRHTLQPVRQAPTILVTELSRIQRKILKLLKLPVKDYAN
jgi:transposase